MGFCLTNILTELFLNIIYLYFQYISVLLVSMGLVVMSHIFLAAVYLDNGAYKNFIIVDIDIDQVTKKSKITNLKLR